MSEKARIVIAIGLKRDALILATDSVWVLEEVDAISTDPDDIGILNKEDYDNNPGLYLWEGMISQSFYSTFEGGSEPDGTDYHGTLRPILSNEMTELLAMYPPEYHIKLD